jgi:carbon monoxide dehydrogenase subunit G
MSRRIESQKLIINCLPEKVFNTLGNFDNFTSLLPEQVANWQSTGDSCSFEVKGLATLGLRITSKTPFSKINMKGEGKIPFGFNLETYIQDAGNQQCQVQLIIDADMNPFIAMMAEKPLQNFVDALLTRLKEEMEKK